jgi:hypothetical protein
MIYDESRHNMTVQDPEDNGWSLALRNPLGSFFRSKIYEASG